MMSVVLTLSSCTNEDFYSSSENNSKQEIISKSLWKEDTLFTKRIYDHFQKSFMSTKEHQQKFVTEHGTPVWEYTMTMGFRRNQLFVPLIQNNTVIGVMRVQRQDKKAFYDFTKDSEALSFFDVVMYNRNLDKLQPQKDEKLNENISSKGGGYTWSCTKRTVKSGYHLEGDMVVIETSIIDVCKYTYTGGKPYVDYLDVYTDGMEGGGGGEEEELESPSQDIIDNLQGYSCAQELVKELPDLKNIISASMKQIFANNEDYNIIFKAKSGLGHLDGITYSSSSSEFNSFKATIYLNDQMLLNATKEYILVTMFHEVVHAFLDYEKFRLGNVLFHQQYPNIIEGYDYAPNGTIINTYTYIDGHQQLMPFLTTLQSIVSAYNPDLPQNVAVAMSRYGIATLTPEQSTLNTNERDTSLGNYHGTKCQ